MFVRLKSVRRALAMMSAMAGLGLMAGPALAHHSFAMFDKDHPASMTGTVKQLNWSNPHIGLFVYADAKPGEAPALWTFESSSPGNLTRSGWTRLSFAPGDKVQVQYLPLRGGGNGGELVTVTQVATGKVFGNGAQ
jgi:hypothetical protein